VNAIGPDPGPRYPRAKDIANAKQAKQEVIEPRRSNRPPSHATA
jgi:hypothetical protein